MRTLHQLYILLLEEFKKFETNKIDGFICDAMDALDITEDELNMLDKHFRSQRPTKRLHAEFYNNNMFMTMTAGFTYVLFKNHTNADLAYELRIQFLNKLISEQDVSNK